MSHLVLSPVKSPPRFWSSLLAQPPSLPIRANIHASYHQEPLPPSIPSAPLSPVSNIGELFQRASLARGWETGRPFGIVRQLRRTWLPACGWLVPLRPSARPQTACAGALPGMLVDASSPCKRGWGFREGRTSKFL
ncbi:hypothetical protein DPEC_G00196510 [Dallia pectoralis]|uniref:Uncharacterized protein n=1 Tax=Dallia pectoralis TaxID=75939 RepID=A0ACC2G7Y3_DALPE|nr:hypothetical protein DPEC_G00196510 [Dallia pectoralis]